LLYKEITDKEVNDAIKKYNKSGFISFNNYIYVKSKDDPKYFDIFRKQTKEHITDGENISKTLKDIQKTHIKNNKRILSNGKVFEKMVPIDDIVWITNRLDSKEYIVKG
jgi:hypothetical protein